MMVALRDRTGSAEGAGMRRFVPLALLVALGVASCTARTVISGGSPTGGSGSTTAPPTSASPSVTPPSPAASPVLADGRYFVFIKDMRETACDDCPGYAMTFDLALWFTGEAANEACVEDGGTECDPVPNDYWIRNNNPQLRTIPVSRTAEVRAIDWTNCCEPAAGDLTAFVDAMHAHATAGRYHSTSPFWITILDGAVVTIEEHFLP